MANLIKKDKFYMYFDSDYIDFSKELNKDEKYFKSKLIQSDNYLKYYSEVKSIAKIYEAGFFIETCDCTDIEAIEYFDVNRILKNKEDKNKNIVLLTFGAFSPLHKGHLDMMETVKMDCINMGYNVCGGIISLSHDEYVSNKREGESDMSATLRSIEGEKLINKLSRNWCFIDMWESMYVPCSLNLDKVVKRFSKILKQHDIDLCIVYGSDNVHFNHILNDFLNYCVLRNSENLEDVAKYVTNTSTKVIKNNFDTSNVSSSELRRKGYKNPQNPDITGKKYYEIRNDLKISIKYLTNNFEISDDYFEDMKKIFNKYVENTPEIIEIDLNNQLKVYKNYIKKWGNNVISNDIYDENKNISVSRVFDILTNQLHSDYLIDRETKEKLGKINLLKNGDCILVDDDIASGFTSQAIISNLPSSINIVKILGMNDLVRDKDKQAFDIVDARDFILGAENGGLQCRVSTDIIRVPYFYPYVNLITRASIDENNQKLFMLEIYKLNIKLYSEIEKRTNRIIQVKHLRNNREFLKWLGYADKDSVLNVLKNEYEKVNKIYK